MEIEFIFPKAVEYHVWLEKKERKFLKEIDEEIHLDLLEQYGGKKLY